MNHLTIDDKLLQELKKAQSPSEFESIGRRIQATLLTDSGKQIDSHQKELSPHQGHVDACERKKVDSNVYDKYIDFFQYVHNIKKEPRTGWVHSGLPNSETVACHMYSMALMAMVLDPKDVNVERCIQIALVHDLAEALVGDITPICGISNVEKRELEKNAIENIASSLGQGSDPSQRILGLWEEYEDYMTEESKFVHSLDKLELLLQALSYEQEHLINLERFYRGVTLDKLNSPLMRSILQRIKARRPSEHLMREDKVCLPRR